MPQQPPDSQAQQQQDAQAGLTALLVAAMASAWLLIDLRDLKKSLPQYEAAVAALVFKYGQASAAMAQRFYQQQRTAAGIPGRFRPMPADPPDLAHVHTALGWATRSLWTPPIDNAAAVAPSVAPPAPTGPDLESVKTLTNGVAQKMVVDTGRNTLIDAIEKDTKCRGMAREAKPTACAFCALLSIRGAVYKTGSFTRSNNRFTGDGRIKVHDHCHCIPVPVFSDHYEPPAHVREFQRIYQDAPYGANAAEARNNFRVALERHRAAQSAHEPALSNA